MNALRLAVIGAGHLGRIHAKLANGSEQFDVVGVADPSEQARKIVEEQLGLPTFTDYNELIGQVDAAIVAPPTVVHYEVTSAMLRAGIHCLVEKPLASSTEEASRLVQIAKHHQCTLQTGHVERFNPSWTTAQPRIGAPKFVEAVRAGAYSGRSTDIGVVMDLMIHDLDLILAIDKSPIEQIQASGIALLGQHEDIAEARLQFESGCIATIRASRVATAPTRRMSVYSSKGLADIDFSTDEVMVTSPAPDVLQRLVGLDDLPAEDRMQAKSEIFDKYLLQETLPAPGRNAILDEQNDFAISVQTGSSPAVSGEDGARAVAVANQIVDTISTHQWDGQSSKPWRVGALATIEPQIVSLPIRDDQEAKRSRRRAG